MLQWIVIYFLVFVAARFTVTKTVSSFSECEGLFYKHTEPQGFSTQNTVKICQRFYGYYRFATLYSTEYRIPVYNAFQLTYPSFESTWNEMFSDLEDHNKEYISQHYNNVRGIPFHFYGLTLTIPANEPLKTKWFFETQRHIQDRMEKQLKGNHMFLVTGPILQKYDSRNNDITAVKQIWIAGCYSDLDGYDSTFAYIITTTGSIEEVTLSDLHNILGVDTAIFMDNCCNDNRVIYFVTFYLENVMWILTSLLPQGIFIAFMVSLFEDNLTHFFIQMSENLKILITEAEKKMKGKILHQLSISRHIFILTAFMAFQNDIIVTFSNLMVSGAVSVLIYLFILVDSHKVHTWSIFITVMAKFLCDVILCVGFGFVLSCLSTLLCIYVGLFFLILVLFEKTIDVSCLTISVFFLNAVISKLSVYIIASNCPLRLISDCANNVSTIVQLYGAVAIFVVPFLFVFTLVCLTLNILSCCFGSGIIALLWFIFSSEIGK
ncbi:uncharacterized protein LOC122807688 [Protopterus annectens]|uniref:uncharacterized protein LOC122807688 n=1 Tax=Protopterus annectens TaxID=7888 RepID=UPI001CFA5504|nr:uncharacterized protein LOC122807688 [Protopterus annectens]